MIAEPNCPSARFVARGRRIFYAPCSQCSPLYSVLPNATLPNAAVDMLPLTHMHVSGILRHMRTTLNIDDRLLERARKLSRIEEKTAVVHAGLEALIAMESAKRLAALGGTEPSLRTIHRRRSRKLR